MSVPNPNSPDPPRLTDAASCLRGSSIVWTGAVSVDIATQPKGLATHFQITNDPIASDFDDEQRFQRLVLISYLQKGTAARAERWGSIVDKPG